MQESKISFNAKVMKNPSIAVLRIGIISVILCLAIACNKEKKPPPVPTLPPITQEGKNTFGCYVNGRLFLPAGQSPGPIVNLNAIIDPTLDDGAFGITAYNTHWTDDIRYLGISVGGDSIKGTGVYPLTYKGRNSGSYAIISIDSGYYFAITKEYPVSSGFVKINRYDYDNGIVSGEFEFTIIGAPFQDTIKVTQGRFDYKFQ